MKEPLDLPVGPFTTSQAIEHGLSRWQLAEAVANSAVRRMLRGVYVTADVPDSVELRCRAAGLVISGNSVIRDRTAAWLHGIDVLKNHELEILPPIESCVPRWNEPTRRNGWSGGTRDLSPCDVNELHGLVVTTPLRTVLDLACRLSPRDALAVLDAFMGKYAITRVQMLRESLRYRRRRGVVQLRRLIPLADPRAESQGESWTRLDILDAGLPCPEPQWWVEVDGVPTYRLDLAYPRHRVAIEYDGEEFHTGPEWREHDRKRRTWLRDHGWIVIVVDKHSFTNAASDAWTLELRQALRARGSWV